MVFFSCPGVFFPEPVTGLNLLSFLSELYLRCLWLHLSEAGKARSVSLDALFPAWELLSPVNSLQGLS